MSNTATLISFNLILAYDVSRWGRFQDADESAYYESICKRKGISVAYVVEQFENDGSPVSTIVKGVKRLNDQLITSDQDCSWTYGTVRQVLTNEKYIGNNVYNRRSFRLKKRHVNNPPEMWVRKGGASCRWSPSWRRRKSWPSAAKS